MKDDGNKRYPVMESKLKMKTKIDKYVAWIIDV